MDNLKIDQVAMQTGLTKRAIRYYEEIGILTPPLRSQGGTRYYTQAHVDLLKKIKRIKEALGLPLEELQNIIAISNLRKFLQNGSKQPGELIKKKEELREIVGKLDQELAIIDQKLQKIETVKNDFIDLRNWAQTLVETIDQQER